MISHSRRLLISTALFLAAQQSATFANNGTWVSTAGGAWSATTNWLNGSIADGTDALADFSTINLTADATVALNSSRTVGVLKFGDTTPSNNWFLTNNSQSANILTLATSAGTPDIIVNNGDANISAAIAGTQGLVINGPGSLTLSGANTYTGTTTINANATLIASWATGGTFAPLKGSIIDNGSLTLVRNVNDTAFTGVITGTGTTTITGDGGFLNLGSPGDGVTRLSNQSDLTVNIGLNLFSNSQTVGALNGVGDITSNTGGALANVSISVGNNNHNGTFSGIIDDNGSDSIQLIKLGTGTQILTGNNTYTGVTVVIGGTLQIGDGVTPNANIVSNLTVIDASVAFAIPSAQTFPGVLTGDGAFLKTGAGNLSLTGNSSLYNGNISINGGTLTIVNQTSTDGVSVGASGIAGQNGSLFIPASGALELSANPLVVGASANSTGTVSVAGELQIDSLTINPTGTMTDTGPSAKIQGGLTVNGGSLTTGANFFVANVGATVQNGGTWTFTSDYPAIPGAPLTVTGQNSLFHAQGNITFPANSSANISNGGSMTADASIILSNNTSTLSATGAGSTILAKSMTVGPSSNVTLSNGSLLTLSNLTSSLSVAGTVSINGGNANIPDVAFNGGNLSLLAGSLTTGDSVVVTPSSIILQGSLTSGPIVPAPTLATQTISTAGSTTINPGTTLTISGGGLTTPTLNGAGNLSFVSGNLKITAGDLTLGTTLIAPVLTVIAGSSISVSGNTSLPSGSVLTLLGSFSSSNITNAGTMTVTGAANLTVGNLTNTGTLILTPTSSPAIAGNIINNDIMEAGTSISGAGSLTNNDSLTLNGNLTVAKSFGLINASSGTIVIPANATLQFTSAPFNNSGLVTLSNSTIAGSGNATLTNNASALIRGPGSINFPITNAGIIDSGPGTLSLSASLTNSGTLRASAGGTILTGNNFASNAGTITLAGGIFSSTRTFTNTGLINGFGTLSTAGLTNNGSITFTDGPSTINGNVTNAANHTITVTNQPATFNNNVINNGTIKAISTTITFNGSYTGNAYLSDPSTNTFNSTASVTSGGFMTGTSGDTFNFAGPALTNNGNFTNAGSLQVATAIINNATFTQSGPQSWATGATFTNNAGTASFQSNAKLSALNITAGTVDITSSKLIVEATPSSKSATLNTLRTYLAANSLIASSIPANFALALLDNAALNLTTFGNNPVDSNSLLLSEELLGDANADGHVDLTDLSTVLNNFGTTTPAWTSGNFDNAPTIDLTDLSDVLNNFGATNPNASSSQLPMANDQLPTTPTPEPTSLALLASSALLLLPRRTSRRLPCQRHLSAR